MTAPAPPGGAEDGEGEGPDRPPEDPPAAPGAPDPVEGKKDEEKKADDESSGLMGNFPWLAVGVGSGAAVLASFLLVLGSADSLGDLAREAPIRVFVGLLFAILVAPAVAEYANRQRLKRRKNLFFFIASGILILGLAGYAWAALDVTGTPRAPDIAFTLDRPAGMAKVAVEADRLSADELVLITAGWDDRPEGGTDQDLPREVFDGFARPNDDGLAKREFDAGPLATARPLLVVARIIERGRPRARMRCRDDDRLCDDVRQPIPAVLLPHLDVSQEQGSVTFTVAQQEKAPAPVRVVVVRAGHRVFGAARRVDSAELKRTVPLPARSRGGERVCVAATYLEGRFRCDAPSVSSERFRLPG